MIDTNITENSFSDFLKDALPFIYRADFSGKIIFLGGAFSDLKEEPDNIKEVFSLLGIDDNTCSEELEKLKAEKTTNIRKKVSLNIFGKRKRYLWIGTVTADGTSHQGQFIDIEEFELYHDKFNRLRELTYGSSFLGHQVAMGRESARMRHMTALFVDAVESTPKIFGLDPDAVTDSECKIMKLKGIPDGINCYKLI